MALHQFPQFSTFPLEIQLLIWEEAVKLVLPRVVELERQRRHGTGRPRLIWSTTCHPLLLTCHDSRRTMLRNWPLHYFNDAGGRCISRTIPFNSDIDILALGPRAQNWPRMTKDNRHTVKNVAVTLPHIMFSHVWTSTSWPIAWDHFFVDALVEHFPDIKTVYWLDNNTQHSHNILFHLKQWCAKDVAPYLLALKYPNDSAPLGLRKSALYANAIDITTSSLEAKHAECSVSVVPLCTEFIGIDVDSWGYPVRKESRKRGLTKAIRKKFQVRGS